MSTNQAFINAYNFAPKSQGSAPSPVMPAAMLGCSEIVLAGSCDSTEGSPPPTSSRSLSPDGKRKPLSQVRAENLFGLSKDAPQTPKPAAEWPQVCQQLTACSADKFDAVLRQLPATAPRAVVGIVGATPQSGCSTVAMCLALRSSALGFDTLLVDGDLSHSRLAELLKVERYNSWTDLLVAGESIENALIRGDISGVDLLLSGAVKTSLDPSARFRASLAAGTLRRKYHRVVIDFGAITNRTAGSVGELAAALGIDFLIATATPQTTEADLATVVDSLDRHGLNLAGAIEAAA